MKLFVNLFYFQNVTFDGSGKSVTGVSLILKEINLFTTGINATKLSLPHLIGGSMNLRKI